MHFQAPGKFILAGEHFILYQSPALALPWHSATLQLIPSKEPIHQEISGVAEAWQEARRLLGLPPTNGMPFTLRSDIPLGCGFGSSAALCVAMLRAAAHEAKQSLSEQSLIEQATQLEALFHGRSSGLDPAVVVRGTPLRFHMGQPPKAWRWKLQGAGIMLAVSQEQRQTAVAVKRVRTFSEQSPTRFEDLLQQAKSLVEAIQQTCEQDAPSSSQQEKMGKHLGELLDQNHALLREVGVSSEHLERLVECARQNGAWGAKLTGAGMGGGMFALAPLDAMPALAKALEKQGARSTHLYDPNMTVQSQETDI